MSPPALPVIGGRFRPRLAAGVRLHWDRHDQRSLLLHPEGVLRPSETGIAVLTLCDGRRSVEEIAAVLAGRYGTAIDGVRREVIDFLDELHTRVLVRAAAGDDPGASLRAAVAVDSAFPAGADPSAIPPQSDAAPTLPRPLGLVAELTYGCPLHCPYCSNRVRSQEAVMRLCA
jgi:pyrroloquinoline quinone biosynthesis protein E